MNIICKECRKRFTSNFDFNEHKCPKLKEFHKLSMKDKLKIIEGNKKDEDEPPEGPEAA